MILKILKSFGVDPLVKGSAFSCRSLSTLYPDSLQRFQLQNKIKSDENECLKHMEKGKFVLFHKGKPLLLSKKVDSKRVPVLATFQDVTELSDDLTAKSVFLRVCEHEGPLFASSLPEEADAGILQSRFEGDFVDMRTAMFWVDEYKWTPPLTQASSLLRWNRKNEFCSSCGNRLSRNLSGTTRECPSCNLVHYPVVHPVAIVLLTTPDHSKVILIRQPTYPPGMFSCVAGFVDSGETLLECVMREAAEEVSVRVMPERGLQLMSSQFWPFPSGSLMMACMAYVDGNSIPSPCMEEVEQANWFTPKEVSDALETVKKNPSLRLAKENKDGTMFVPPRPAVANFMLRTWLKNYAKK